MLTLIGDTIIPATADSPGAGSVAIGRFITTMVRNCQPPETDAAIRRALREIETASRERFANRFPELAPADREVLLTAYEVRAATKPPSPFRPIKELVLLGFFTSEPGATRAVRYDPVPGAYRGSLPLDARDRSWAQ
jgi:hypothetical protein